MHPGLYPMILLAATLCIGGTIFSFRSYANHQQRKLHRPFQNRQEKRSAVVRRLAGDESAEVLDSIEA